MSTDYRNDPHVHLLSRILGSLEQITRLMELAAEESHRTAHQNLEAAKVHAQQLARAEDSVDPSAGFDLRMEIEPDGCRLILSLDARFFGRGRPPAGPLIGFKMFDGSAMVFRHRATAYGKSLFELDPLLQGYSEEPDQEVYWLGGRVRYLGDL